MGSLLFSLGLGVKMSLLLALPAVGVVLWLGAGRGRALRQAALMGQVQVSSVCGSFWEVGRRLVTDVIL